MDTYVRKGSDREFELHADHNAIGIEIIDGLEGFDGQLMLLGNPGQGIA